MNITYTQNNKIHTFNISLNQKQYVFTISDDNCLTPMTRKAGIPMDEIKAVLSQFMVKGKFYRSTPIMKHLNICRGTFRKFLANNPDFIGYKGELSGRRYWLR
jgi:hypothetical protein